MLSKLIHSFVGLSFEFNEHTITSCGVIPILLAATFAISCYAWFIKKPTRSSPPLPPGPRALPLAGNILSVEPNLHLYFAKLSQIYGPVFKLYLGRKFSAKIFESLLRPGQSGQDRNEGKSSKDFLQTLLELQQQGDYSLSMDQIKALFMDLVIGSTDTTSITVEWAMSELLQKPEVMRKACNELGQVVALDSVVEEFHLAKLPFLEANVKETLRLHPPAPLLTSRRPSATSNLSGYTIPKGSTIFINAWAIQRNPEVWENPQDFQPDRFLKDVKIGDFRGNNFNYLPFGSGRRICLAIPLAEKIVPYVLANLLHLFEWSLPEGCYEKF
ncbi:cytochrome p450 family 706 subfamily a polypeptide 3-related [Citrus sinensis]|uniref:Cytochrome p450 family 706 subfamily a polypeptide 3-related n=1 Tax=Citrus sinensis TaxID=2711 RepID=A0ACB8HTZ3_CITSI|nr:cytochrome p450 family 706 subfamily a polypeptide 3-related [Citrus sinensis]